MIKEKQAKAGPPKDKPPLGTGIKEDGPDDFGLSGKPGNGRILNGLQLQPPPSGMPMPITLRLAAPRP